jgi:predicted MFS family arabinose efflux permease
LIINIIIKIANINYTMADSDYMITIIYAVSYLTNALINFDHGIIPACTQEMKRDLLIDDVELGTLGSAVYAGLVVGSIAGSAAFAVFKAKTIVSGAILCCILSLSLFLFTRAFYILLISRFLVGFF